MKTTVYIGTSLDGFIAREDGNIDWLTQFQNKDVYESYGEFIKNIDAFVIGRGTYETVLKFPYWPYNKKVFILSNSIKELPEKFKEKATLLSMSPAKLLDHISKEGFSNLYIDGGKVIQSFLKEDLVDEMIITRLPLLIGSGISLFGDLDKDLLFTHLETKVYADGLVKSHYVRKRN